MLSFCDTDLSAGSLSLLWYADNIHFHSICVLCCPSFGQQSSIGGSWILCFSHTTSWCSMKALHQKVPPKKKATIRRMFMAIFWNIFYFLVATSQVRTNSSIKSSFSFHSDERAFVPQQERWFLRSSRFALCNNPHRRIYLVGNISTVHIVIYHLLNLGKRSHCFLDIKLYFIFWYYHIENYIEKPHDFSIFKLLFSQSTSHIRGILYAI